mgnify:FL=1
MGFALDKKLKELMICGRRIFVEIVEKNDDDSDDGDGDDDGGVDKNHSPLLGSEKNPLFRVCVCVCVCNFLFLFGFLLINFFYVATCSPVSSKHMSNA